MREEQGLQYNVRFAEGKAIKKPTSRNEMAKKLVLWDPELGKDAVAMGNKIDRSIQIRSKSIKTIRKMKIDLELLANPVFEDNGVGYTQDQVVILEDKLSDCSQKTAEKWFDKYIESILRTWENGFADTIYNFLINCGIDTSGRVVLIDFGELTFNKTDVQRAIEIKKWLRSNNFEKKLGPKLREYGPQEMEKRLTIEALNQHWPTG